ncbi:hypothetical protein ACP70R_029209 [Stipagrostis hirtigluma subsp. patula]
MEEEHCMNNWDLDAVVRLACRRRLSRPPQPDPFASFLPPLPPQQQEEPAPPTSTPEPAKEPEEDVAWCFPDLCTGTETAGGELPKAVLAAQQPPLPPPLPPPSQQRQQQPVLTRMDAPLQARAAPASAPARAQPSMRPVHGSVPRSKRRKNQVKKVVRHVPAEDGASSDVWAWRKYGQKPIKGSPYPRGYYRCSSSKGCAARKQVERSRADPSTLILTYTGEHNHAAPTHRNSLAGTTRHKLPSSAPPQPPPPSVVVGGPGEAQHQQPPSPTSTSAAGLSPTSPLRTPSMEEDEEEEEEEEEELLVEDVEMAGEDELLFLSGDTDGATPLETTSSLFDIDEPFLSSPWTTTATSGERAGAGT